MTKSELVDAIASGSGIGKANSERVLDTIIDEINKTLKKGDRVAIVGFGSFSVKRRGPRIGRNPQTGDEVKIAARNVVKFKAGANLAEAVNK